MTSNIRIKEAFANASGRAALIPYVTAGDPSIQATPTLMHALVKSGADIIELGVPFSDPMADGPVIQRAAERAIARGTSLRTIFNMVASFRETNKTTPVVLMGYANPVERMGQSEFARQAQLAGIDGVLIVDYPPEEADEFAALLMAASIDPIFLLAPTSTEQRIQQVAEIARGYIYYVSLKGVTGAATLNTSDVEQRLKLIRKHVSIPVGVGFGIRDAQSASKIAGFANAVVIGSKLIETMEATVESTLAQGDTNEQAEQAAINAAADWLQGIRNVL